MSAQFKRYASYTVGMILLAIGLTLTAQTHLGTSPLTSVAYVLAEYTHNTFSNMTLLMFTLFVLAQIALAGKPTARKTVELLLQIPLSLVFTRVMGAVQRFVDLSGCTLPVRRQLRFLRHWPRQRALHRVTRFPPDPSRECRDAPPGWKRRSACAFCQTDAVG